MLTWIFKVLENVSFYLSRSCVKSELTTPSINEVRMTFRKFWQPFCYIKKTGREEYTVYPFK